MHDLNLKPRVKVSEYDQEIPQSQTADNPMAPRGRATQPEPDFVACQHERHGLPCASEQSDLRLCYSLHVHVKNCADPGSFVRGSPTLTSFLLFVFCLFFIGVRDLIFFTTELQTVNYTQQFTAIADLL